MPFTFAHPGYALFVQKKYLPFLSLNGLVFGSLAPDVDILFRFSNIRFHIFSFQLMDVIFQILPMALLMSIVFHLICRNIIIDHLPLPLKNKFKSLKSYNFLVDLRRHFVKILLSMLLGIYLHIFLDYIFHWNANSVMMAIHTGIYPWMAIKPLTYYGGWYLPLLLSTLLGFWLILEYNDLKVREVVKLLNDMEPRSLFFLFVFCLVALVVVVLKSMFLGFESEFILHYLTIHLTSGFMFSLFITPFLFLIYSRIFKYG